MVRGGKKKDVISRETPAKKTGMVAALAVFVFIGVVYFVTLIMLFPNLPITTRQADTIPGYDRYYPPFRTDEYNYYGIGKNILSGKLYEENSFERGYPPGFSLVALPFIAVLGEMGGYAANVVIVLLSVFLFYCVIRRYNSRAHVLALVLIMAFATLNWFYAVSCYSEPLSQFLVVLSVYLMMRGKDTSNNRLLLIGAGIVTGLNLFVRPHYIVLAVIFFGSLWVGSRSKFSLKNNGILYACGVSAVVILWVIRNTVIFGSPLAFEYTRMLVQFFPGGLEGGVKGNVFAGTHRLLFDEFHGLLTITPILLVFPAGLRCMWCRGLKNESITFFVSVVIMTLIFASGPYTFTEFGLGSRHLMPIFPLMMLPAVFFIDEKLFSRAVILILALYSFYHAGIGWFTGTFPGIGFFPGFLNDSHARAIILARKGVLPKRTFKTGEDLLKIHIKALNRADMFMFLQTSTRKIKRFLYKGRLDIVDIQ